MLPKAQLLNILYQEVGGGVTGILTPTPFCFYFRNKQSNLMKKKTGALEKEKIKSQKTSINIRYFFIAVPNLKHKER